MKNTIRKYAPPIFHCINDFGQGSLAALIPFLLLILISIIINRRRLFSVIPLWRLLRSLCLDMWLTGGVCHVIP